MQILTDDGQLTQSDPVWLPTSVAPQGQLGFYAPLSGLKVSFRSHGVRPPKVSYALIHQNSEVLSFLHQGQF